MLFTTKRLYVRELSREDLPEFHRMQNDHAVMRYVGGKTYSLEENKADLERVISFYKKRGNDFWVWAIMSIEDHRFIGTCALVKNEKDEYEIGFRLLKEEWKKGFGKEITNGLLGYGFDTMKLSKIVAYVNKNNVASVKILDSTFRFIKEFYNDKEDCIDRYYQISN
ncbi:GNAT family N-acetyltransferase [Robertkochia sediminum]|uniref:GNAT family N-acetyltransferase n=1 Tax=Robertkochia sediminum TaxID=2785326 RepID=UPI001932E52D|nr:GNAT family N-acetyltransferase [Robertkochia sediminum]MBL7472610.1 GNAT family N-acetyltransferase [Robertkochia sediminum]